MLLPHVCFVGPVPTVARDRGTGRSATFKVQVEPGCGSDGTTLCVLTCVDIVASEPPSDSLIDRLSPHFHQTQFL
jgi:hypothetical protein